MVEVQILFVLYRVNTITLTIIVHLELSVKGVFIPARGIHNVELTTLHEHMFVRQRGTGVVSKGDRLDKTAIFLGTSDVLTFTLFQLCCWV